MPTEIIWPALLGLAYFLILLVVALEPPVPARKRGRHRRDQRGGGAW